MRLIITKIGDKKPSKYDGFYKRVIFRSVEDNKSYRLDVFDQHSQSIRWLPYLKAQGVFDKVNILPHSSIIDGNSPFIYIGLRHPEKPKEEIKSNDKV